MSESQAIVVREESREVERFMPIMSMSQAVQRHELIVEAVQKLMRPEDDFGVIPGTKKPTLYQPGADKLNNLFGLVPRFETLSQTEDWTGKDHGGEPFFYYRVRCQLFRGDYVMGEGEGSCNSWESKYRYRKGERVCLACGKETIIKGKAEYGGGWLCFAKRGGCGAKYKDGDQAIEGQVVGSRPNPDVAEVVNTILKMACKRAKIAATLNATSAHEFFTQDVEDLPSEFPESREQQGNPKPIIQRGTQKPESEASARLGETPPADGGASDEIPGSPRPGKKPLTEPPPAIAALWTRMIDFKSTVDIFGELKRAIVSAVGNDRPYYDALALYGMAKANDIKGKPRAQVRLAVAALQQYIEKVTAEPPPASFQATDEDLPEEIRA